MIVSTLPPREEMLQAFARRDPSYEGVFVTAVRTTGIFCRPTCSARRPSADNVEFFATPRDALFAGYRPCLRCSPLEPAGAAPGWLRPLLDAVAAEPERRWRDTDLVARWSGDEFVLLLDGVGTPGNAERVRDQVERVLRDPVELGPGRDAVELEGTVGLALSGGDTPEPESLIRAAEDDMLRRKPSSLSQRARCQNSLSSRRSLSGPRQPCTRITGARTTRGLATFPSTARPRPGVPIQGRPFVSSAMALIAF